MLAKLLFVDGAFDGLDQIVLTLGRRGECAETAGSQGVTKRKRIGRRLFERGLSGDGVGIGREHRFPSLRQGFRGALFGVKVGDPLGQIAGRLVERAGLPIAVLRVEPEDVVGGVAGHQDGSTVFEADADDLGPSVGRHFQLIAQRGDFQIAGAHGPARPAHRLDRRVVDAVHGFVTLAIEPLVTDDSVESGFRPREKGRVARASSGWEVVVVGIQVVRTSLHEEPQTAYACLRLLRQEVGIEALNVVGPELVDADHDDELRRVDADSRRLGEGTHGDCGQSDRPHCSHGIDVTGWAAFGSTDR